jgi:hypothetical protein
MVELFVSPNSMVLLFETKRYALVDIIPVNTARRDMIINTNTIFFNNFKTFGGLILAIDKVIVTNINGTIIVLNRLINKFPNGVKTFAFSLNIKPINRPKIMLDINTKEEE